MLQIHNSLTGTRQQFRPPHAPHVGLYVCGVTVYDYCHVGHARCYVVFDVVRRWLRQRGYQVAYVRNITDIDDKIIRRAAEAGMSIGELAARYTAAMREDFAALGIEPPDHEPLATAHIPGIIAMIGQLVERGYAYVGGDGDVFYAVGRFAGYGQLSGKRLADLRAGARVATDEAKRDPLDFVLWKRAKPQEPAWESPWGPGRPGWHIECSAMSTALLGTHFDIHGGGMDLKFPHHENEIAQSCGAHDGPFVDVWMHNGFVTVDDEKMSKSLGNFFTIRDVLPRLRHPEVLRTFLLSSHYRGPINYSQVQLEQADAALCRLYTALRGVTPAAQFSPGEHSARFAAALDDDFNTPEALAALQGLARALNAARARAGGHAPGAAVEPAPAGSAADAGAAALAAELRALGAHLGLLGQDAEGWFHRAAQIHAGAAGCDEALGTSAALNEARIEALIEARLVARKARNFAAADRIRGELAAAGVVLEDQPGGRTTWRRD